MLERRFATGGNLNAPWGMVLTPTSFGPLGGNFWSGNFGDGNVNTFDGMGNSKGQPTDDKAKALNVDGLWALVFGDGTNNAATTSLYFTAGPNMESEGISANSKSRPRYQSLQTGAICQVAIPE